MANQASSVGMMDGAFFVGRGELLAWVNDLLGLHLTKVEQAASGAVHCQIIDACHPGVVPMHKVNYEAKNEHEFVSNYKVLQTVFDKLKITRNIDVPKLIKARPLDNLEFLQWMKCYYDNVTAGGINTDYNPEERRSMAKGGSSFVKKSAAAAPKPARATSGRAAAAPTSSVRTSTTSVRSSVARESSGGTSTSAQVKELQAQNTELRLNVERTEQEREFYFEKLQDIEFLCQRPEFENNPLTKVIEKILYFTEGKPDIEAIIAECGAASLTTEAAVEGEQAKVEEAVLQPGPVTEAVESAPKVVETLAAGMGAEEPTLCASPNVGARIPLAENNSPNVVAM